MKLIYCGFFKCKGENDVLIECKQITLLLLY